MYIFVINDEIRDIERRDIDLSKYYHSGVLQYFIEVPDGTDVTIGDYYVNGGIVKKEDINGNIS